MQTDARGLALKCGLQRQHVMDQVVHLNQKETPPLFREISSSPVLVETAMSPSPSADLAFLKRPSSPVEHSPAYLCSTKKSKELHRPSIGFLLEYGLIKSSDVKCSLQILVWQLTLKYRGSLFIFVIQTERRVLEFNRNP